NMKVQVKVKESYMLKKRLWMVVTLAVLMAMFISACTVPVPPPAAPADTGSQATTEEAAPAEGDAEDGVVTLTWGMWGSPAEIATHQAVADAFMAEHPEIKIEITSEPWSDYFTKMQ